MKKLISFILALVMLFGVVAPAVFAQEMAVEPTVDPADKNPIIYIRGNGNPIYDNYGYQSFPLSVETDEMISSLVDSLGDDFLKAVTLGKWDDYYAAFETEFAKFYEGCALDENGNIANNSGIANLCYDINNTNMNSDYTNADGNSDLFDYVFWYDWRLDPFEIADQLENYIDHVLAATGAKKVSLVGKCLGGSFVLAYLAEYGGNKIRRVAFDCTTGGGCEKGSDLYSGKAYVDFEAMERHYVDSDYLVYKSDSEKITDDFVEASLDLINESDRLKLSEKTVNGIYKLLSEQLTPRLCMASYGRWPGYWTNIKKDSYEEAKKLMFYGKVPENAEKYKGLIEKLDKYDKKVRQRIPELLKSVEAQGVNFGVLAKYGYQISPLIESRDMLGDALVSLEASTFGATCSKVYDTLSDSYIAKQESANLGKYISPDKQVDASTCVFPDSTWMIKGMVHENWAECNDNLIYMICTSKEPMTVSSSEKYPQFMVYDPVADDIYPMTADNIDKTKWDAVDIREHTWEKFINALKAWFEALKALIENRNENK